MIRISGRVSEGLGDALAGALGGQRDQVRVEAGLGEDVAGDLDGEREQRQHRAGWGLTRTALPVAREAKRPG